MSDVARAAGVSTMTVSNVVNGRPHVREETRARVVEAIDALGYRMNLAARNLRAGRTGVIGLAVPDLGSPYFSHLSELFMTRFEDEGVRVVVERTGASRAGELEAASFSRLRMYDGLVLSAVGLGAEDVAQLPTTFPTVLLGERALDQRFDHVMMANREGSRLAVAHLLERGCRRVVALGGTLHGETSMSTLRTDGYRDAHAAAGIPMPADLVIGTAQTLEGGERTAHELLDRGTPFDGVFAYTDQVAMGFIRGLADRGVTVPGDVLVVGFDDVPAAAHHLPRLSSVHPDHAGMVDAVSRLLLRRIAGDDSPRELVTAVAHLEVRESSVR
ncbi:LacI family DNA-binding transcriptional regulator [Occultella kanbiaonis]|uniref:LacI family DNA-binding transcriptional regulator n=1 Tax=Occultella kanbiaonis TaxID=2675754 RepID=UPI0013CF9222|nr:LacI family DNA-binding transcriptional regulator [Occultella kanbiaonis]